MSKWDSDLSDSSEDETNSVTPHAEGPPPPAGTHMPIRPRKRGRQEIGESEVRRSFTFDPAEFQPPSTPGSANDPYMSMRLITSNTAIRGMSRKVTQIPQKYTRVLRQLEPADIEHLGEVQHEPDAVTPGPLAEMGKEHNSVTREQARLGMGDDCRRFDWMITVSDPTWTPETIDLVLVYKYVIYAVMQREQGTVRGSFHWQMYVEFNKYMTREDIAYVLQIDINHMFAEPRRLGRTACRTYCTKVRTRVPGTLPIEYGEFKNMQGHRSDMDRVVSMIDSGKRPDDIFSHCPGMMIRMGHSIRRACEMHQRQTQPAFRDVHVIVFVGTTGTGKTRQAVEMFPDAYIASAGMGGPTKGTVWFDGYEGQSAIILDDYHGWLRTETLLVLLDGYKIQVPIKGGMVPAMWTTVIITSNSLPIHWVDAATGRLPNAIHMAAVMRRIHCIYLLCNYARDNHGIPIMYIAKMGGRDTTRRKTWYTNIGRNLGLDIQMPEEEQHTLPAGPGAFARLMSD